MAENSSCGWTKEEREDHLRACGFTPSGDGRGKGSHVVWVNPEVRRLYEHGSKIEVPAFLLKGNQKPWEIPLCGDPAGPTWHKIEKHSTFCREFLSGRNTQVSESLVQSQLRKAFRDNRKQITEWRHNVKFCMRMGQELPKAPACYPAQKLS